MLLLYSRYHDSVQCEGKARKCAKVGSVQWVCEIGQEQQPQEPIQKHEMTRQCGKGVLEERPTYNDKTSGGDSRLDKSKASRFRLGKGVDAHCYF